MDIDIYTSVFIAHKSKLGTSAYTLHCKGRPIADGVFSEDNSTIIKAHLEGLVDALKCVKEQMETDDVLTIKVLFRDTGDSSFTDSIRLSIAQCWMAVRDGTPLKEHLRNNEYKQKVIDVLLEIKSLVPMLTFSVRPERQDHPLFELQRKAMVQLWHAETKARASK